MKPTPVMSQYLRLKQEAGDAILLFRMGDFYEMFMEDAVEASRLLDLTLTSRDKSSPDPIPMAGVPWHSASSYVSRLLKAGRRVAICEQIERPGGRGLMEREIVEILTPGTAISETLLEDAGNVFLAAVAVRPSVWGIAAADVSTGEFHLGELPPELALEELERILPRELLVSRDALGDPMLARFLREQPGVFPATLDEWQFSVRKGSELLKEHYGVLTLEPFGIAGLEAGIGAAGALLCYAQEQRRSPLKHLRPPTAPRAGSELVLDDSTLRNLEVLTPLAGSGKHSLLATLDATLTPMGARALRQALARPSAELAVIEARHEAIQALVDAPAALDALRGALRGIADIERLLGRAHYGRARPQDLGRLRDSLARVPPLCRIAGELGGEGLFPHAGDLDMLEDLTAELSRALADSPALAMEEGRIRAGYDARLDELRGMTRDGETWLAQFQERERRDAGIPSLKVGYNKVFGYYIEVTHTHGARVPTHYERKQTLVNAERYVTSELREWEGKISTAREDAQVREKEILARLTGAVVAATVGLQALAAVIAGWDLLANFALRAREHRYVRPRMDEGDRIEIRGGRHPVVERFLEAETFVPNDVDLDARGRQIQIITGPNMAGKSTYLRQIGLIVLMAQAGSFVPADEAAIGIADRIFTRVGANDNIARGHSTFLVEMIETSRIPHAATSRSLVLLDEIGRGTSTFDGLAIAWAVAEHLRRDPLCRPRTLFATHFHELTALAQRQAGYINLNILVKEWKDRVIFVRRVAAGAADRSYGIQVARLAGLPEEVLERAREILVELEEHGPQRLLAGG
ncbi:MAG: DNA mismatch repair protein MutS, partial [Candidatus Eisenbacteria bacterium]